MIYFRMNLAQDIDLVKRHKILKWLSGGSNTRYEELQSEAVENSGRWFLDSAVFSNWADTTKPAACLWCVGIRSFPILSSTNSRRSRKIISHVPRLCGLLANHVH